MKKIKDKIELIMPTMRPVSAMKVVQDLVDQSRHIDKLTIVDNDGNLKIKQQRYPFRIKVIRPKENIGVNAVWNLMWKSEYGIVGVIGDDFGMEHRLIELLSRSIYDLPGAGAITATIFKDKEIDYSKRTHMTSGVVTGRGHLGVTLFKKAILERIPKIPKELFVFYGDNWIGYWLNKIGKPIYEVSAGISHYTSTDLKIRRGESKARKDKDVWIKWKTGKIELQGKTHE